MAQSREIRVGLFLLVAFLIVIALFELLGRETLFSRSVEYRTSFKSIPTLKLGDPVRLAGVDVGTVKDIRIIGARVEVVMRLKPATPVKTDSVATIKLTSLVSSVIDQETQQKIDVVKTRMISNYGYCQICATDVLNYVASIFARGDPKARK